MKAESFYQTHFENAVPFERVSGAEFKRWLQEQPEFEQNSLNVQNFKGLAGDVAIRLDENGELIKAYIGTGEGDDSTAIAIAVSRLPSGCYFSEEPLANKAAIAWSLAQYQFDRYKKSEKSQRILAVKPDSWSEIIIETAAVYLVRDLINTPAEDMSPQDLAQVLHHLAEQYDAQFEQWIGDDLKTNNFPAIHAVGRAANAAPRLLSLTWGDPAYPKITLIGKGVCFDSGGLDVKPSNAMRLMKKDMGGAAQAIGLAQWIMAKSLPISLQVLIPAVENAIGSNAFRPGDVLTMRNGLTVEVDNTDAEGRLILADALTKACERNPDLMVDFATLTGAARAAVGTELSAMFTNNDELAAGITKASHEACDPIWRLPLFSAYESLLDSSIADLANCSASPFAGAITAALFLQRFIDATIPWVHFDLMAWNVGNKPGKPEGGEAMAMQAMAYYLNHTYSRGS